MFAVWMYVEDSFSQSQYAPIVTFDEKNDAELYAEWLRSTNDSKDFVEFEVIDEHDTEPLPHNLKPGEAFYGCN